MVQQEEMGASPTEMAETFHLEDSKTRTGGGLGKRGRVRMFPLCFVAWDCDETKVKSEKAWNLRSDGDVFRRIPCLLGEPDRKDESSELS